MSDAKWESHEDFDEWLAAASNDELLKVKSKLLDQIEMIKTDLTDEILTSESRKQMDGKWIADASVARRLKGKQVSAINDEIGQRNRAEKESAAKLGVSGRSGVAVMTFISDSGVYRTCALVGDKKTALTELICMCKQGEHVVWSYVFDDSSEIREKFGLINGAAS